MALTGKQRAFINEYLICWNATEAARRAGYAEASARISGSKNMSNANIAAEIQRRIDEMAMSADEVLLRLGNQARGSIGDFLTVNDNGDFAIDLTDPTADLSLIKKLKHTRKTYTDKDGNTETTDDYYIELYDAHAALVDIGKHHGAFTEKVELSWRDRLTSDQRTQAETVLKAAAEQIAVQRLGNE